MRIAIRFGELLDEIGLRHMVCGSVASSIHGEPRSTIDVDFVVEFGASDAAPLAAALGDEFFVDREAIEAATRTLSSCNVIHRESGIKIDLFRLREREFSRSELERSQRKLAAPPNQRLTVATPEDMILTKLEWYRKGGEASDQQWRDVCGLLKMQSGRLDASYLAKWAETLGVADLLARAQRDSGL